MERMTSIVFITTDVDYLNLWISHFKKQKSCFCQNDVELKRLQKELAKAGKLWLFT